MKVKVKEGWQVASGDGKVHGPGDTFDANDDEAQGWVAAGYVEEVKSKPKKDAK